MAFMAVRSGDYLEIAGAEEKVIGDNDVDSTPKSFLQSAAAALTGQGQAAQSDSSRPIDYSAASASRAYALLSSKDQVLSVYSSDPKNVSLETPRERFARIQAEVLEFKEQMEFIVEKEKSIVISSDKTNSIILEEISRIQGEIETLVSNEGVRRVIENNVGGGGSSSSQTQIDHALGILRKDLQADITQNLIKKVKGIIEGSKESAAGSDGGVNGSTKVDIFIDVASEKLKEDAKYVEMERRIALLEKEIKPSVGKGSVSSRVDTLFNQVSVLQSEKSEVLLRRIADLEAQIEKVATKRAALNQQNQISPADLKRIEVLHDRFQTVAGVADVLPAIVDRMEALKTLHEESAGLVNQIHSISSLHEKITKGIQNNQSLLEKVNANFSNNLEKVLNNIQSIEARIQALSN